MPQGLGKGKRKQHWCSAMAALILSPFAVSSPSPPPFSHIKFPGSNPSCSYTSQDFSGVKLSSFRSRKGVGGVRASNKGSDDKPPSISFGDRLLDYIEGGPKLRKWYGAPDQLPRDGVGGPRDENDEEVVTRLPVWHLALLGHVVQVHGERDGRVLCEPQSKGYVSALTGRFISEQSEEENDDDAVRDAVLVTDADSETGQLLVLALILKRLRVRALVRDAKAATAAFGPYVEPVVGDVSDIASLKKGLQGVRAVICPTKVGALADKAVARNLNHIVFLSQLAVYRREGSFTALFKGNARVQAEQDEKAIASTGVPYTIVRPGILRNEPGGQLGFNFVQDGTVTGSISREDAASICVRALDNPPQQALIFEVVNKKEKLDQDWRAIFSQLKETSVL